MESVGCTRNPETLASFQAQLDWEAQLQSEIYLVSLKKLRLLRWSKSLHAIYHWVQGSCLEKKSPSGDGGTEEGREAHLGLSRCSSGSQSVVPGPAVSIRTTWQLIKSENEWPPNESETWHPVMSVLINHTGDFWCIKFEKHYPSPVVLIPVLHIGITWEYFLKHFPLFHEKMFGSNLVFVPL